MFEFFIIIPLAVSLLGWWSSQRRLRNLQDQVDHSARREMTEVLPEVAHRALITMYSTLFSITDYVPFIKEDADHYFSTQYSDLGLEYRDALHQAMAGVVPYDRSGMSPLEFAKASISAFDSVLARYKSDIDTAHEAMLRYYEGRPMPVRDQQGFNWVRLW